MPKRFILTRLSTIAGALVVTLIPSGGAAEHAAARSSKASRLIVLTDIEADPDDTQSLVRLLLYSNVIEIQGLIAVTSTHQRTFVAPESIRRVIRAYGNIQSNLAQHDVDYPKAEDLLLLVKQGLAEYGMRGVGAGKDSEGSEWIIRVLRQDDDRPLWISVWGGANTLAQALQKIKATSDEKDVKRLIAKLRIYTISDQDDCGIWIRNAFPDLFYVVSPGGYGAATWTGINQVVPGIDNSRISNKWIADNIQQGHGPLGAAYPDVAYGMEGDTPSWLSLIPNGLNAPEHPNWGGWGGRYELCRPDLSAMDAQGFTGGVPIEPETRAIWTNAFDEYAPAGPAEYGRAIHVGERSFRDYRATVWRWRDDFQNDFAARMDWTCKAYADANHPPVPTLGHADNIAVKSGERFQLDARGTEDPDGDSLSFFWFHYPEAGTYRGRITFSGAENLARVDLVAPKVEKPETAHFILKITDKGNPPLTRYKRVIVTMLPE